MSRIAVKFFKKQFQPIEPEPNSVYFVQENEGDPVEMYVTDADGEYTDAGSTTFVEGVMAAALELKADLNSPEFTGIPTAPTAGPESNSDQIATTAFVQEIADGFSGGSPQIIGRVTEADTIRESAVIAYPPTDGPDPYLVFEDMPSGVYEVRGFVFWDNSDSPVATFEGWESGRIYVMGEMTGRISPADPRFVTEPEEPIDPNNTLDFYLGVWLLNGIVVVEGPATLSFNWTFLNSGPVTLKQGSYITLTRIGDAP